MSDERHAMTADQYDSHLDHLLIAGSEEPWWKSFISNIRETINPPKLPPLEVTSKPVAVKDIWGKDENKNFAGLTSLVIHTAAIALIIVVGSNKTVQSTAKQAISLIAPVDVAPLPEMPKKPQVMGGGGGGGDRSPLPASKGKLPKIAPRQFTPPMAVVNNPNPKLVMEPTIVVQPDAPLPNIASANFGNPLGIPGPPSNGTGSGGGIGSGSGGGVGSVQVRAMVRVVAAGPAAGFTGLVVAYPIQYRSLSLNRSTQRKRARRSSRVQYCCPS